MSHQELLAKIKHYEIQPWSDMPDEKDELATALRAVVGLHKPSLYPEDDKVYCFECQVIYPCSTIQVIEKALL